jgi:hypothetical protein
MSMCSQYYLYMKKTVELLKQDGCWNEKGCCNLFNQLLSLEFPWYDWYILEHTYFQ